MAAKSSLRLRLAITVSMAMVCSGQETSSVFPARGVAVMMAAIPESFRHERAASSLRVGLRFTGILPARMSRGLPRLPRCREAG